MRTEARVHTTLEVPPIDRESVDGFAAFSPTRTLIDLARMITPGALTAALDGAIRDGLTEEGLLIRRIYALRNRGRHGLPKLLDVLSGSEATRGGHSWLEREFLRESARAGLPRPKTQQVLTKTGDRLVRVDCHYPGTTVVVELLGYRWHRTPDQLRRDTERMNALVLTGLIPLQFTTAQLLAEPATVFATIRSALGSLSAH